jgi:hypothetical protein
MITPEYKKQLTQLHSQQKWGAQGWKCLPDVLGLILQHKLKKPSILDYGAGECTFQHTAAWALPQARVTSFDPGIPEISKPPGAVTFDIVVCTDVLEHVEPQFVDQTLLALRTLTGRAAHLCIACTPAKTMLPDGRNAHLVVEDPSWWLDRIRPLWNEIEIIKQSKLLILNAHA